MCFGLFLFSRLFCVYAWCGRNARGQGALRELLNPLVTSVVDDTSLQINTHPVEVYKQWINQTEVKTGQTRSTILLLLSFSFCPSFRPGVLHCLLHVTFILFPVTWSVNVVSVVNFAVNFLQMCSLLPWLSCLLILVQVKMSNTHLFYGPLDFVWDYLGELVPEPIWIYWSKRQRLAVASAGPHANLHLVPDR